MKCQDNHLPSMIEAYFFVLSILLSQFLSRYCLYVYPTIKNLKNVEIKKYNIYNKEINMGKRKGWVIIKMLHRT